MATEAPQYDSQGNLLVTDLKAYGVDNKPTSQAPSHEVQSSQSQPQAQPQSQAPQPKGQQIRRGGRARRRRQTQQEQGEGDEPQYDSHGNLLVTDLSAYGIQEESEAVPQQAQQQPAQQSRQQTNQAQKTEQDSEPNTVPNLPKAEAQKEGNFAFSCFFFFLQSDR